MCAVRWARAVCGPGAVCLAASRAPPPAARVMRDVRCDTTETYDGFPSFEFYSFSSPPQKDNATRPPPYVRCPLSLSSRSPAPPTTRIAAAHARAARVPWKGAVQLLVSITERCHTRPRRVRPRQLHAARGAPRTRGMPSKPPVPIPPRSPLPRAVGRVVSARPSPARQTQWSLRAVSRAPAACRAA